MRTAQGENVDSRTGLLKAITEAAGLLGAVVALIYFAGATGLAMRLAIEHLPWSDVVSQLPREVILSVGGGQVLLPALIVAAFYAIFRMLRGDHCKPPVLSRARDGVSGLPLVFIKVLWIILVSSVPVVAVLVYRVTRAHYEPPTQRLAIALVVLTVAAFAIDEARAVLTRHFGMPRDWKATRSIAATSVFYCLAAVPAMVLAAASLPLNEAKVCTVDGTEERGMLVGQSSETVYLGEKKEFNRRLAIFPMSKVDELFVGPEADRATCEVEPTGGDSRQGRHRSSGS